MDSKTALQLATVYLASGNFQQAETICKQILKERPADSELLYLLGIIYSHLGNYDSAINYIKRSLQINSGNANAYYTLGLVLQQRELTDEAIIAFQEAIQIHPNFTAACDNLNYLLLEKKQIYEIGKPKTKRRVALVNDTLHWYHWGCTGTSTALHQAISGLGYDVFSIPINRIYNCQNSPKTLEDFDSPDFFKRFNSDNTVIMEIIKNADIVVINGEGSLHGLRPNVLNLLYLAYLSKVYLGKNVQIINHSCYPDSTLIFSKTIAWTIYEKVYKVLDFIAIREPISFNLMKKAGISAILSFDCLPLYITKNYNNELIQRTNNIIITSSMGRGINFNTVCAYIAFLHSTGFKIQFLTGASAFPSQDDMIFIQKLSQTCSDNWDLIKAKTIDEWLYVIQTAKLIISGRFHHTIAAAILGTPYILLESNTPKNIGLATILNALPPLSYADTDFLTQLISRSNSFLNDEVNYRKNDHDSLIDFLCNLAQQNFLMLEKMTVK